MTCAQQEGFRTKQTFGFKRALSAHEGRAKVCHVILSQVVADFEDDSKGAGTANGRKLNGK